MGFWEFVAMVDAARKVDKIEDLINRCKKMGFTSYQIVRGRSAKLTNMINKACEETRRALHNAKRMKLSTRQINKLSNLVNEYGKMRASFGLP